MTETFWTARVVPVSGDFREVCLMPDEIKSKAVWVSGDWGIFEEPALLAASNEALFRRSGGQRRLIWQEGWSLSFFKETPTLWDGLPPLTALQSLKPPGSQGPYLLWRHRVPALMDREGAELLATLSMHGRFLGDRGWQPLSLDGLEQALDLLAEGYPLALAVVDMLEDFPQDEGLLLGESFWQTEDVSDWSRRVALWQGLSDAQRHLFTTLLNAEPIPLGLLVLAEEGLPGRRDDLLSIYENKDVRRQWRALSGLLAWRKEPGHAEL